MSTEPSGQPQPTKTVHKTNSVPTSTLQLSAGQQSAIRSSVPVTSLPSNSYTLRQTSQLDALLTIIRDRETPRGQFIFYSDRIIRLLVEEGLNHLPTVAKTVVTPTGAEYHGVGFCGKIAGVSSACFGRCLDVDAIDFIALLPRQSCGQERQWKPVSGSAVGKHIG